MNHNETGQPWHPSRRLAASLAALMAVASLVVITVPVEAGKARYPYCSDACRSWRPCEKTCRVDDNTLGTCGDFGECNQPIEVAPPPPPPADPIESQPTPKPPALTCDYEAPPCEFGTRCPAFPTIKITTDADKGLKLKFEASGPKLEASPAPVWKFGDADPEPGATAEHEFTAANTYAVSLTFNESSCNSQLTRKLSLVVPLTQVFDPQPVSIQ